MFLLASVGAGQILGDAGMTVLIGFAVVFMMLLLLTGVFKLFGLIMAAGRRKKKEEPIAAAIGSGEQGHVGVVRVSKAEQLLQIHLTGSRA